MTEEFPAIVQLDDGTFVPTRDCTRDDIRGAIRNTDSREEAASLRKLLRVYGRMLDGGVTINEANRILDEQDAAWTRACFRGE